MKTNIVLYIVLLLCGYFVSAQNEVFKLEYKNNLPFTQEISQPEDKKGYIIKLTQGEKEKELRLTSLTIKTYQNIITSNIEGYDNLEKEQQGEIDSALKDWVVDIMLWTFNNLDEDEKIGLIKIKEQDVSIYNNSTRNIVSNSNKNSVMARKQELSKMKIDNVDIEFRDGFIEQIIVDLRDEEGEKGKKGEEKDEAEEKGKKGAEEEEDWEDGKTTYRFNNPYGIGFSTIKNFDKMNKYRLFCKSGVEMNGIKYYNTYIMLSDVLQYKYNIRPFAKEFSPADGLVNLNDSEKEKVLFRTKSDELISGTVFSDFTGFKQERPNGLVETEFYRKIFIWTVRRNTLTPLNTSHSFMQYIKPVFTLSKIEENNRDLLLSSQNRTEFDSTSGKYHLIQGKNFTNPLRALNHQIFALGTDLNLLYLDMRSIKSEFHFNYAFRYRRFNLVDSLISHNDTTGVISRNGLVNEYKGNGLSHGLEATWRIVPEERYGFHITFGLQHLNILTNEFELRPAVPDQTYLKETNGRFLWSMELGAFLKTSKDKEKNDRFFLRWRLNWEQKNAFNNFVQLQFGYTVPFTRPNRK